MMFARALVINFSGAYEAQGFLQFLQGNGEDVAQVVNLIGTQGTCCYCDPEGRRVIDGSLPAHLPKLRWLDSGDYHYMSHLLALRETEPFHLVLLDNHPDNQEPAFGGVLSCGSWVKAMQEENPMLRSVLTIGPEGCPAGIPQGWLEKRSGERLYMSLDKDIMGPEWARTNWSQGAYSLDQVKTLMGTLLQQNVVALDICGELQESKGATPEDLRINLETNIELQKFITTYLK